MGSWSLAREGHMVVLVVVALVLLILGEQSDGKIHGSRVFNKKANESLSSNSSKSVQTSETIIESDEEDDETDEQPPDCGPVANATYGSRASELSEQNNGRRAKEDHYGWINPPCGRVPIYQKVFGRSINESSNLMQLSEQMDDYDDGEFRIVNGVDAVYGEWPWIAEVSVCKSSHFCTRCTGTLLNNRWIITAGHCVNVNAQFYNVRLAKYDRLTTGEHEIRRFVDRIVRHPNYVGDGSHANDLSLMRLSEPVQFNDYIQPVCLIGGEVRDRVKYTWKRKCYAVGYGVDRSDNFPLTVQKLPVEATYMQECNKESEKPFSKGSMCIKPSSEHKGASCYGDSGGPNLCYDRGTNQWVLHSTVSHGPADCVREEGDKWLTVSMDIGHYLDWIIRTISRGY